MTTTIDCEYVMPKVAAAYLLHCGDKACFIDNNTNHAVPLLLAALKDNGFKPDDVAYIIITHVHLDHAGATGLLLEHCPKATVIAHPRAAPHVIDPSRLVQSAQSVYGEAEFKKLYGTIQPVPESRVYIPADGEVMQVGDTELQFIYTRGHANHHFVILDRKTNSIFTGDSFGIAYPMLQHGSRPFLFASTSPTDFDAAEARASYAKIVATGAAQAYPTHFGVWSDLRAGHAMLSEHMTQIEKIFEALKSGDTGSAEPYAFARSAIEAWFAGQLAERGINLTAAEQQMLGLDIDLNAQGLVFAAARARKKAAK
ncbi:MBL fold metallo-hydrolase [Turneriella parva]|nr:MBL fold metallo-hydrolase [Turneriella parva]